MKKIILNQLRREKEEKLISEEYKEAVGILQKKHKMSYNDIVTATGIPKTTIARWVTGNDHDKRMYFNLDAIMEKLKHFEPTRADFKKLKELKQIIEDLIVKEIQYKE